MKGKTVLITGASRGIGREIAIAFAGTGANLVLTYYISGEEGRATAEECKKITGGDVMLVPLNVRDDASIKRVVSETESRFGGLDILINNSGVIVWKPLSEQSFSEIETQARTNYEGLVKLTRECIPLIGKGGQIINIASGAGKEGYASLSTYCGTKFAVRGFSQALAQELKGIRVFCVNPGMTATRMTGFKGIHPKEVAKVVLAAALGKIKVESGGDVDVWEHATSIYDVGSELRRRVGKAVRKIKGR